MCDFYALFREGHRAERRVRPQALDPGLWTVLPSDFETTVVRKSYAKLFGKSTQLAELIPEILLEKKKSNTSGNNGHLTEIQPSSAAVGASMNELLGRRWRTLPRLIVFDVDYTLWPYWCDCHTQPPYTKRDDGRIIDGSGQEIVLFDEVPSIVA